MQAPTAAASAAATAVLMSPGIAGNITGYRMSMGVPSPPTTGMMAESILPNGINSTPSALKQSHRSKNIPGQSKVTQFLPNGNSYYPAISTVNESYSYNGQYNYCMAQKAGSQQYPSYAGYPSYVEKTYYEDMQGRGLRQFDSSMQAQYQTQPQFHQAYGYPQPSYNNNMSLESSNSVPYSTSSQSYHVSQSVNSSNNSGSNPAYVTSLLQAIPPPDQAESNYAVTNSFLSQLRADSVEVTSSSLPGNADKALTPFGNDSSGFSEDEQRRAFSVFDSLFPSVEEDSSPGQMQVRSGSHVSSLLLN
jgi:hypothetical protein